MADEKREPTQRRTVSDMASPDWAVRNEAAGQLADIPGDEAFAALVAALDDADTAVVDTATESLIRRGDPAAVELIWAALGELDEDAVDQIWSVVWERRHLPIARDLVELDQREKATQTTGAGLDIPVPKRSEFDRLLDKAEKPPKQGN